MGFTVTGGGTSTSAGSDSVELQDIQAAARLDLRGVFNVKDAAYGALGDGSTNDRPAIQSAINAAVAAGGGIVYIPAGTYLLNSVGPLSIPRTSASGQADYTAYKGLRIIGAGRWVTTLKLTSNAIRCFDLTRQADYDKHQGIVVEDLAVDANNVASANNNHLLIGSLVDGGATQRGNFQGIIVRRVRGFNAPAADTDGVSTGSRAWILVGSRHPTTGASTGDTHTNTTVDNVTGVWRIGAAITGTGIPDFTYVTNVSGTTLTISQAATASATGVTLTGAVGEATQTYVKDCVLEDADFAGAASAFNYVGSDSGGAHGANVYVDNILVQRVSWDRGVTPAAISSSGNQIGGSGFGGRVVVRDCFLARAGDVNLEIDAMSHALVDNVVCRDAWNTNFYYRCFTGPEYPNAAVCTWRSCTAEVVNLSPSSTVAQGNTGWALGGDAPWSGTFLLENCKYNSRATAFSSTNGLAIEGNANSFQKVILRSFQATLDNLADTSAGATTPRVIRLKPATSASVVLDGVHIKIAGTTTNASLTPQYVWLAADTSKAVTVDVNRLTFDVTLSGMTAGNTRLLKLCEGATSGTLGGLVRRMKVLTASGDTAIKAIAVVSSASGNALDNLLIEGCNLTANTNGTDLADWDGPQRAKTRLSGNRFRQSTALDVASASTIGVWCDAYVNVTGTTGITSITAVPAGESVRLKFAGALTVTDGSNLKIDGNFITAADATLTLVSDGTNFYEQSRSVN